MDYSCSIVFCGQITVLRTREDIELIVYRVLGNIVVLDVLANVIVLSPASSSLL